MEGTPVSNVSKIGLLCIGPLSISFWNNNTLKSQGGRVGIPFIWSRWLGVKGSGSFAFLWWDSHWWLPTPRTETFGDFHHPFFVPLWFLVIFYYSDEALAHTSVMRTTVRIWCLLNTPSVNQMLDLIKVRSSDFVPTKFVLLSETISTWPRLQINLQSAEIQESVFRE